MRSLANHLLGSLLGKSLAASALFHAGALGVFLWTGAWLLSQAPLERVRLAGHPRAITIDLQFSPPESPPLALELVSESPRMTVMPLEAHVAEQVYLDKLSTAVAPDIIEPLAEVSAPSAPATNLTRSPPTLPTTAPPLAHPPQLGRLPTLARPRPASLLATVAQQLGAEATAPPDLSGNRPPRYPDLALQNRWEGTVLLRLHISHTGAVTTVEVLRSSGYGVLDAAAASAARTWRGQPARRGGLPVATVEQQELWFHLP